MNIFNRVTLQSLKKNRARTLVSIFGIILSAAMICAVSSFTSSIYTYVLENAIYANGDWHGSAEGIDGKTYEKIKADKKIESCVYGQDLGYSKIEGCKNENKPYLFLLSVSAGFNEMMPVHISSGKYPTSSAEILIPDHLYENGGVELKLGDSIQLALGERILDGRKMNQNDPFYIYNENNEAVPSGETLKLKETRSYTIVGFYERPAFENYTAPGYTAITIAEPEITEEYRLTAWFRMKKTKELHSFIADNNLPAKINSPVLKYAGVSRYTGFNSMINSLSVIVIVLIMLGSVSLIYNAFSISVAERTKQFALLSSLGASKRQLRRMVVSEALMLSAIGIPLGILAGLGGIGITLLFVGGKFEALIGYPLPLKLSVSAASLVIAALIALLTVLLSAIIPARRATKLSAIEAIRQSKDIRIKAREVRTSKLTYKAFGLPGMLAGKYYRRSRKKYRATVLSLFMSIVLFISASAFTSALSDSVRDSFGNVKYDILIYGQQAAFEKISTDRLLLELKKDKGVDQAAYTQASSYYITVSADEVSKDFLAYYAAENQLSTEEIEYVDIYTNFSFVDDHAYSELLNAYKLSEKEYLDPDAPKAIVVDGSVVFDSALGKHTSYNVLAAAGTELSFRVEKEFEGYDFDREALDAQGNMLYIYESQSVPGDSMCLSREEAFEEKSAATGKIIYEAPFYIDENARLTLLYPMRLRDQVLNPENFANTGYSYYISADMHLEAMREIDKTISELGLTKLRTQNIAEQEEENRNIVIIIQVFAYGFILLISLIAATNVFNTISTNIALRRREFAMLKSVGMTAKGFNRMMNFECILYGTRSLFFGLPTAIAICYLIHLAVSGGYQKSFTLPWFAIGIATLSLFLVVFITMLYSMRKIKKDNPIDALKNENL
ncbi:MAG: ABC transporter permease [Bacillota bacterium]|nr:ABC transporter permease [Bacillota bacterium]